ncbi:hypothetical protein [Celeribacter indicus]|uniref:Porin n=1 Tax=Celeribacter indicus TaxID=1208324 RepID=A0A0B5DW88_9RHOB|nr:hypothetical protein [Celeribacter indicus]AJE47309.1 hypothetical protein P73_2594 [Celeribacter indicus]SDW03095.1 hypothetical protein SAMN05443573_101149 [Celeribacter indicus]
MSQKQKISLALALISATGAAAAEGVTYTSVELSHYDLDGIDATLLNGNFDYVTGPFSFTGGVLIGEVENLDMTLLEMTAGYAIVPGVTVYGMLGYVDTDDFDDTAYGLGVEYQTGDYGAALQYETSDDSDADSYTLAGFAGFGPSTVYGYANDVEDFSSYGLGYKYDGGQFEANIATDWAEGGLDTGLTAFSGEFDTSMQFTVLASVITGNEDFLDTGIATIGGRYAFTDSVSLEANYGTGFGDLDDADGFALKLKLETGGRRMRVTDQVDDYAADTTPLRDLASY